MPIVNTNSTIDTLTANEVIVVQNGATATINRPIPQRAGAISPGAGGGRFLIDGRNIRQLAVASTSGLTLGRICTFGNGVTGEVVEITGLRLQFRSLSGAVPSGTTINASGYSSTTTSADSVGFLVFMQTDNTVNTTNAQFTFEARGQWIVLGAGAGASGQTLNFYSTAWIPGVWVETGNGTNIYERWANCASSANMALHGNGIYGRVFWQSVGSAVLNFGNGTNGNLIPSGARIRVPNVLITAVTTANAPTINATVTSRNRFTATNGGAVISDCVAWSGFYHLLQGVNSFNANSSLLSYMLISNSNVIEINECIAGSEAVINLPLLSFQSSFFANILNSKVYWQGISSGNSSGMVLYGAVDISISASELEVFNRQTAIADAIRGDGDCVLTLLNCSIIGGTSRITAGTAIVNNLLFSDRNNGLAGQNTTNPISVFILASTKKTIIQNFNLLPNAAVFRNHFANLTNTQNTLIENIGTLSSPLNLQTQSATFILLTGRVVNTVVKNCYTTNPRPTAEFISLTLATSQAVNFIAVNISVGATTYTTPYRVQGNLNGKLLSYFGTPPTSGFANADDTLFYSALISATVSETGIFFNLPTSSNEFEVISGSPRFDRAGTLTLAAGDQAVYTSPVQPFLGTNALADIATNASTNIQIEYRIISVETVGAWKIFDASNVQSEAISSTSGFRFQIRLTCTVGAGNAISRLAFVGATTAVLQAATNYPSFYPIVTVREFLAQSAIGVLTNTGVLVYRNQTLLSTPQLIQLPYPGSNTSYTARARRYGFNAIDLPFIVDEFSNAISFSDRQTLNPAISLSESAAAALTPIGIDHAAQTITITSNRSLDDIFHRLQWQSCQLDDLRFPVLMETNTDRSVFTCPYNFIIADGVTVSGSGKTLNLGSRSLALGASSNITASVVSDAGVRFRLFGLPTNAGANPVVRVKRVSTGVITNPIVSSGEAYFTIAPNKDYEIRADACGYVASRFVTINSASASSLQVTLDRIVDASGNPVYEQGNPVVASLIAFDLQSFRVTLTYSAANPQIDVASAFRAIENYLTSPIGLELTAHPVYNNGGILLPRDIVSGAINPLRIQSAAGNVQAPELLFVTTLVGGSDVYAAYDLIRPIKFPTTLNLAVGGSGGGGGSGGLTPAQEAALTRIDGRVDVAVSSRSSGAIPTPAQNATATRTELAAELGRIDIAVSSRSTVTVAEIEASTVLAKTAQLPAAPDNAGIAAIKVKTDALPASPASSADVQITVNGGFTGADRTTLAAIPTNPLLTNDTRLNRLDANVSSRATSADIPTPAQTTAAIEVSTVLAKEATVASRATQSSVNNLPTAAQIATAVWGATVRALTDKDGFALSATSITAIWAATTRSLTTFGSLAADVWAQTTRTLTARPPNTASDTQAGTIQAKTDAIVVISGKVEAAIDATALAKEATVLTRATPADVQLSGGFTGADRTALNAINPPTVAAIRTAIEASTVLAKVADLPTAPDNTAIAAILAKVNPLTFSGNQVSATVNLTTVASQASLNTIASQVLLLYQFRGLDPANPWAITDTGETAGSVVLTRSDDGTTTTVSRQS